MSRSVAQQVFSFVSTVIRSDNAKEETYIGLTENAFETRYNNHVHSFNNPQGRNATTLSDYIWKLKDKNIDYSVKWQIMCKAKPYSTATKRCNLCITEKFFIICRPSLGSLNKRNELTNTCRHKRKHLLCNATWHFAALVLQNDVVHYVVVYMTSRYLNYSNVPVSVYITLLMSEVQSDLMKQFCKVKM